MPPIGVDGTEHDIVVEHQSAIEVAEVELEFVTRRAHPDQARDTARGGAAEHVADDDRRAGAFHHNVGLKASEIRDAAEMKGAAEVAHQRPFHGAVVMIEHVNVEAALRADQGREQTDWSGAGDQQRLRLPGMRAPADAFGVVPRLGEHAGRLDQNTFGAEPAVEFDQKLGLDSE
jgi:hypothetical protein